MTSTDTAAESLEEMTKKSQDSEDPPEYEPAEKQTYIRFLVSKKLAGSLIGKGGSTITEFQANSGARILLSRRSEYFPGTTHRVVVVSGTIKEVVTALELVLGKFHSEFQAEYASDIELKRIRIVVPHSSCGGIIGKRGATIKSIIEESKAGVHISSLDNTFLGLSDRLVTLSGTMEEQMRAVALVLTKLTEDDEYSQEVHSPNSYAGLYNLGFHGSNSVNYIRSLFGIGTNQIHQEDNITSMTVGVPDDHIGVVIGPGGNNIKHINLLTGARMKVSGRGDFVPGTTDRKVTITGFQDAIQFALSIIEAQVVDSIVHPQKRRS